MKLPLLSFLFCLSTFQIAFAQIPKVYCTYWTGSQEILGTLNFTNQTVDPIGPIEGSNSFAVATANGYDPYRNRYYVLSNLGLVALDAANGNQVAVGSDFATGNYKHLSYNPATDQIYVTRYNGTAEEYFLVSPETFTVQSQGLLPFNTFVVGCYGLDPMANEILFYGSTNGNSSISTINIATGQTSGNYTKASYIFSPLLPAYDPLTDKYYGVGSVGNLKNALLEFRKSDFKIDTVGVIPGITAIGIAGSAIDPVSRRYIFYSNLKVVGVSLDNPNDVITIPLPQGAGNIKGFQTNHFASPPLLPRSNGELVSMFKNVEGWYRNGVVISGTENLQTYSPSQAGVYHYKITRTDGTSANSNTFSITSVDGSKAKTQSQIYPNPAHQKLFSIHSEIEPVTFELINVTGQTVLKGTLTTHSNEIDIRSLSTGIYQFRTTGKSRQTERLVVE